MGRFNNLQGLDFTFKQSSDDYEDVSIPLEFFNEVEKTRRKSNWLKKDESDNLPADVDKVAKKFADDFIDYLKGGKSNSNNIVEKILKQCMPNEAIAYMKWSLNNGKKVHVYGRQGDGKSAIRDMFAKYQYPVTAPEDVDPYEESFLIPKEIFNVSLIEVAYRVTDGNEVSRKEIQSVRREDIEHWLAS